ncbi:MAG: hypothetical protein MMC23_001005 [Stictis urceolatum]|nr:hypothetical protein [Stictis urceolata]
MSFVGLSLSGIKRALEQLEPEANLPPAKPPLTSEPPKADRETPAGPCKCKSADLCAGTRCCCLKNGVACTSECACTHKGTPPCRRLLFDQVFGTDYAKESMTPCFKLWYLKYNHRVTANSAEGASNAYKLLYAEIIHSRSYEEVVEFSGGRGSDTFGAWKRKRESQPATDEAGNVKLAQELFREGLGQENKNSWWYYSFCKKTWQADHYWWHCEDCGCCENWRSWHCKTCKTCGEEDPCHKCGETSPFYNGIPTRQDSVKEPMELLDLIELREKEDMEAIEAAGLSRD